MVLGLGSEEGYHLGGLMVNTVTIGGALDAAGLRHGDVICRLGDSRIETMGDWNNALGLLKRNQDAEVGYLRPSKKIVDRIFAGKLLPPYGDPEFEEIRKATWEGKYIVTKIPIK